MVLIAASYVLISCTLALGLCCAAAPRTQAEQEVDDEAQLAALREYYERRRPSAVGTRLPSFKLMGGGTR
jgi:hypothetical protein